MKATFAKAAGALGTIVYNNVEGVIAGSGEGALGPVVSIPLSVGTSLVAQLASGATVVATLKVDVKEIVT